METGQQQVVCPGQKIMEHSKGIASSGTYVHEGYIVSTYLGNLTILPSQTKCQGDLPQVIVKPFGNQYKIPLPGNIIIGKVIKISPRAITLRILLVENSPCNFGYQGIIRIQDISNEASSSSSSISSASDMSFRMGDPMETISMSQKVFQSYRPGDIVKAEVIALGEGSSYYLTTKEASLGVLYAFSSSLLGNHEVLIPRSATEMLDPLTGMIEPRKVIVSSK